LTKTISVKIVKIYRHLRKVGFMDSHYRLDRCNLPLLSLYCRGYDCA